MSDCGAQSPNVGGDDFHFIAFPEHILVWMGDTAGRCSFVSPSWQEFTGREAAQELDHGWLERVHADDRDVLRRGLASALRERRQFRLMFRCLRGDGLFRWLVMQGMPRNLPNGEFAGQIGLCFDVTPYQEGEAECEQSARHMIALLRQTRLIAAVLDVRGRVQFSNGGLCRLLRCSGTELVNCELFERHLAPGNRSLLERLYPDGRQNAHFPAEFESELVSDSGAHAHVSWHAMVLREHSGRIKGAVLIGEDVTAMRRDEERLALSAKIFEATHHALLVTDIEGTIVSVNDAFTVLTGHGRDEALGRTPRILKSDRHDKAFYEHMWATLLATGHWHGDVWDRRKDGSVYPKYLSISAIKDAGVVSNYVGIFYDISERKTMEERLDRLAHYDALTGMPNRCLLLDRLDQAAERATRQGGKVALLYLDLDHFKEVNDTMGHGAGDALLKAVAQRMRESVRAADTVARLGGDEFVVLLPDFGRIEDVAQVAQKVLDALSRPYAIENRQVVATPSIGVSIFPDDSKDMEELIRHADAAMYQVKQSGRGNFSFFHDV